MTQRLQVTNTLSIVPLVTLQSSDFQEWYRQGVWWSHHGREGSGPLEDTYFPDCLTEAIRRNAYADPTTRNLARDVAFYLGMIHGGVLTDTGILQHGITTLVQLHETKCLRGYHAGREFFFLEADTSQEWTFTEDRLLTWVHDVITDYQQSPDERALRFTLGDVLGNLSGHLFPWTSQEQHAFDEESLRLCGYVVPLNPRCLAMQQRALQAVS